jgi:hypothetical protein
VRTPDRRRNRPAAAFILTLLSSAPPAACLTVARDGDRRPATAATPQAPPIGGPGALAGRMPPVSACEPRGSAPGIIPLLGLGRQDPRCDPGGQPRAPGGVRGGACWGFAGTNPGRRTGHPGRIVSLPHPARRALSATLPAGPSPRRGTLPLASRTQRWSRPGCRRVPGCAAGRSGAQRRPGRAGRHLGAGDHPRVAAGARSADGGEGPRPSQHRPARLSQGLSLTSP